MLDWVMGILGPVLGGGEAPWEIPEQATWDIPDPVSPTDGWYDSLDPNIMAGLNEPWNDAQDQMFESLGQAGSLGSGRGGLSGAAGAALGEFSADRASAVGLDAWNMVSPGLVADYNSNLDMNRTSALNQWQASLQQNMAPFTSAVNLFGPSLPQLLVDPGTPGFIESAIPGIMGAVGGYYGGPRGAMAGYGVGDALTQDGATSYTVPNNFGSEGYNPTGGSWDYNPSSNIYDNPSSSANYGYSTPLDTYYDQSSLNSQFRGNLYDYSNPTFNNSPSGSYY